MGHARYCDSAVETIRIVGVPAPNFVAHVFPHSVQDDTDSSPSSGSVVPSWSQRSIRCPSVSHSACTVTQVSFLGPDGVTSTLHARSASRCLVLAGRFRPGCCSTPCACLIVDEPDLVGGTRGDNDSHLARFGVVDECPAVTELAADELRERASKVVLIA